MNRRCLCIVVAALCLLLAAALAAEAQQIRKTPRIAFIFANTPEPELARPNPTSRYAQAFLEGMRQLGWIDGQNITIEWRTLAGHPERSPAVAQELVKLPADVVVTSSTSAATATRQASSRIPIVVAGGDPVETGLAQSLAHPGGTVTGLSVGAGPQIIGKRLQLLKEACPRVSRVAVLFTPARSYPTGYMEEAVRAVQMEWKEDARTLGLTLARVEVTAPEGIETAFVSIQRARVRAMVLGGGPFFWGNRRKIIEFAAKENLPVMYWDRIFAESGGLMSYGPDYVDLTRRAVVYVDKILKGADPGTLPIEQPTKFELVINVKTAKALGLTIPSSLLARADQVIQ